jgi:hypothetical protein
VIVWKFIFNEGEALNIIINPKYYFYRNNMYFQQQILNYLLMKNSISRRKFFYRTVGAGTGVFVLPSLLGNTLQEAGKGIIPLIITSHTNETGRNAMEAGWEILKA